MAGSRDGTRVNRPDGSEPAATRYTAPSYEDSVAMRMRSGSGPETAWTRKSSSPTAASEKFAR